MTSTSSFGEPARPDPTSPRLAHEQQPPPALPAPPAVVVGLAAVEVAMLVLAFSGFDTGLRIIAGVIAVAVALVAPGSWSCSRTSRAC